MTVEGSIRKLLNGFGFVSADDKAKYPADIFFHFSQVRHVAFEALSVGDRVKFTPAASTTHPDRLQANDLELVV